MTTITTQLKTELQSRINAITGATSLHDLIKLRSAARGLQLNETVLDTQLTARVAALSPVTALDDLFKNALALPVNINPTMIGEIKPFNSGEDSITDIYGGIWLRAGIITYDTATYPDAQKLPLINNDPSVVTPVAQPNLSGITQKRIASNGSVVVAINPAGTSLTRFTNFTSTGTNIAGTGVLSGATWFSITWDERLGLFVMLGRSNLKIVTSPDGSNWSVSTVPGGAAAPATNASSLIFAAAARIHLVILNKHYTTTDLVSWVTQTDIAAPNADTETLASRDLRGMVQAPGGQVLLWGAYYSTSAGYLKPFIAVGDGLVLACTFSLTDISSYTDSDLTCAAFKSDTEFEISVTSTTGAGRKIFSVLRSTAGVFSVSVQESSIPTGEVPTAAMNYLGLIVRASVIISAWNVRRSKSLPYTATTANLVSGAAQLRASGGGAALVRLGTTFYQVGNGSGITAFDFKWMIGMPLSAALDGGTITSVGSYAANFVRIK